MGSLVSLIAPLVQANEKRREKKEAKRIAANYSNQPAQAPSTSQPQAASGAQQSQRSPQESQEQESAARASEWQEQQQREQHENEINTTLGAARVGFPAAVEQTPASAREAAESTDPSAPAAPAAQPPAETMASDEDYMAFLDKANADPNAGVAKASHSGGGTIQLKAVDRGAEIPRELKVPTEKEEWIYVSDADEPFVAVSLKLAGGKLPDEETFAKLINYPNPSKADIEILDVVQWDSEGHYKNVVDACRKAAMGGDVRVYKVRLGGTRFEYWVVGVEGQSGRKGEEGKLVGVKALAIES